MMAAADLGQTFEVRIGVRENGFKLDRLVLSTTLTPGSQQIDFGTSNFTLLEGLANSSVVPEPATLGLLALGGLMFMGRRASSSRA